MGKAVAAGLVALIRCYQWLTRRMPPVCRFQPSCSQYAVEALQTHGPLRGVALAVWRILRCNPLCPGGYDPVPARKLDSNDHASSSRGGQRG